MSRYIQDLLDVNYSIAITYLPSGDTISFSAFLNNFEDTIKQEWNSEDVYGRMDSILSYKNTKRAISITFFVPSESSADAQANFIKLGKLMRFSYPVYEKGKALTVTERDVNNAIRNTNISAGNALLLSSPPLVGIKFANLISSPGFGGRLIGKIDEVKYKIDKDATFFSKNNNLYTNVYEISLNMTVLHTQALGWERDENGKVSIREKGFKFPHGF